MTRIHGDEFWRSGLSIAVDKFAIEAQLTNDSKGTLGVGGFATIEEYTRRGGVSDSYYLCVTQHAYIIERNERVTVTYKEACNATS